MLVATHDRPVHLQMPRDIVQVRPAFPTDHLVCRSGLLSLNSKKSQCHRTTVVLAAISCRSSSMSHCARGVRRNTAQSGNANKSFSRCGLESSQRQRLSFIRLPIAGEQLRAILSVWMDLYSQSSFSVTNLAMRLEQVLT